MSKEKTEIAPAAPTKIQPAGSWAVFNTLDEAWRYADCLSKSQFVPKDYQGKINDCMIAIEMAERMNIAPLMFLQNSYIVHGRPGMESKLVISLINQSGLFSDPLDYETVGVNPEDEGYQCRAFASRKSTGKILFGPWITWKLVKSEGWAGKSGSKWKTMPEIMFHYRAASWFANRHCPEVKMGIPTADELRDQAPESGRKKIESKEVKPTGKRMSFKEKEEPEVTEVTLKEVATTPPPFDLTWTCTECGHAFDEVTIKDKIPVCPACGLSTGLKKNEKQTV